MDRVVQADGGADLDFLVGKDNWLDQRESHWRLPVLGGIGRMRLLRLAVIDLRA